MVSIPFPLRRIWLLARGAFVDRDKPDLERLDSIEDPESFVWSILPHAARSFAPSILLLPEHQAREAAVGYLYARMLDTYEDLSETPAAARAALDGFAARFDAVSPRPAPPAPRPAVSDLRDRAHLLLIDNHHRVDRVFAGMDDRARERVIRLVKEMADGMSRFSTIFEDQRGVLRDRPQVLEYCHSVIGLPALFVMELLLGDGIGEYETDALEVSVLIQLANITRDIEKDLRRRVAYHPSLEPYLGTDGSGAVAAVVASARRDLMLLATRRARSFRHLVHAVGLPRISAARASAVLMMLYTDRYYRGCASRAGMTTWSGPQRVATMVVASLPAVISTWWANRVLLRVERDMLAAA